MRYFFNQVDTEYNPDNLGREFDHIDEARIEAVRYASEVMRDHPTLIWTGQDFRIEVTDSNQLILFTIIVIGVDAPSIGNGRPQGL